MDFSATQYDLLRLYDMMCTSGRYVHERGGTRHAQEKLLGEHTRQYALHSHPCRLWVNRPHEHRRILGHAYGPGGREPLYR